MANLRPHSLTKKFARVIKLNAERRTAAKHEKAAATAPSHSKRRRARS